MHSQIPIFLLSQLCIICILDHNKLCKIVKGMCLLKNPYACQEATVKLDMKHWTGSKLGKEYVNTIYCHPACLTYVQST